MSDFDNLAKNFNKKTILEKALTHRSWVNEHSKENGTNERLEFLGDAILEFIVSDHIFKRFPKKEEGFLTALRANLVNTENLSVVARNLEIGSHLRLSKGEEQGGGRDNPSLLADTVEAVIGAIYLDQGFNAAKAFIDTYLLYDIDEKLAKPLKDPKSRLQEFVQSKGMPAPKYRVAEESGPDHDKIFKVVVYINSKQAAEGQGSSKSRAEQAAAEAALVKYSQS